MTIKEAYDFMFHALDNYWRKTRSNGLGGLLGGLNPRLFKNPKTGDYVTADPAAWHDWLKAVRKVTNNEIITEQETLRATVLMLKEYNDHHGFDLAEAIAHFSKDQSD